MLSRPLNTSACAFVALLALALAGCGGDDEPTPSGEPPVEAPSAADFPDPGNGSIDDLIAEVGETNEIVASPAGAGSPRFWRLR